MGWSFRKSIKVGPARVNLSKSGVGYSVGAGGLRYTKRANAKKHSKAENRRKINWKVILGVFCIIGGLANLPDNIGSFAVGLILGIALLLWGTLKK